MTSSGIHHRPIEGSSAGLAPSDLPLGPLSGHVWSDLTATIRTRVSPWYCLIYPLSTLQTRNICLRYCQPTVFPPLLPSRPPYIPPLLSSYISSSFSPYPSSYVGALHGTDPLILSSSNNIISLTVNQLSLIFRVEGFTGWYRGFGLSVVHLVFRDMIRRCLYTLFLSPRVKRSIRYLVGFANCCCDFAVSSMSSSAPVALRSSEASLSSPSLSGPPFIRLPEVPWIGSPRYSFCAPLWRIYLVSPVGPAVESCPQPGGPRQSCWWSANSLSKYLAEILSYPLLTATTRLVVYEGPERLRSADAFFLTLYYDGAQAFFRGIFPYLLTRSVDEVVDASTRTMTHHWIGRSRLSASEMFTLRACCAAAMNALTAPLNQLSIIQRCQSSMEGLCVYRPVGTLLSLMPWKAFSIQLILASALLTFNYMTLISKPPPCQVSRPAAIRPMLPCRRFSESS
eukprot:GHVS01087185.1.p1 GENE.GHVS01087185.1~~GHVS01087185.1.p1  ORF type:complete len:454 (-),score=51.07 GHVS01087185.1:10-1371(-)